MKEQWRYRCPEGHTGWHGRSSTTDYYCETCRKYGNGDPRFDRLVDAKTGAPV